AGSARGARAGFFFSGRRRHTRWPRDWSSDVCSSDLGKGAARKIRAGGRVPAVIYGHGGDAVPVTVDAKELFHLLHTDAGMNVLRSEERRVGKECRARAPPDSHNKK